MAVVAAGEVLLGVVELAPADDLLNGSGARIFACFVAHIPNLTSRGELEIGALKILTPRFGQTHLRVAVPRQGRLRAAGSGGHDARVHYFLLQLRVVSG